MSVVALLWTAFFPSIGHAQRHHRRRPQPSVETPAEPAVTPPPEPPIATAVVVSPTSVLEVAPPIAPSSGNVTNAPAADELAVAGVLDWAVRQPLSPWVLETTRVRRWHAYISVGAGVFASLESDPLGLSTSGAIRRYPGLYGPNGRLEVGAGRGPWSIGLSVPALFGLGGGVSNPGVRGAYFAGAEARVSYIHPLGSVMGVGGQLSFGCTLAFIDAVIDAQGVAHRLAPHAFFSGEAGVVFSERIGDRIRLEQQVGVRLIQGDLLGGTLATIVGQLVLRFVL